jgi:hypothetical protein
MRRTKAAVLVMAAVMVGGLSSFDSFPAQAANSSAVSQIVAAVKPKLIAGCDESVMGKGQTQPPSVGKDVPIVLVHGLWSGPGAWYNNKKSDPTSTWFKLNELKGFYVDEPFNYEANNAKWVTDEHIGLLLARRIDCLSQYSIAQGGNGVVAGIGHSMGGLALRDAQSRTVGGRKVANELKYVVTIGTPNEGSGWADIPGMFTSGICNNVAFRSAVTEDEALKSIRECQAEADKLMPAILGMQGLLKSDKLKSLPEFSKDTPVLAIAGALSYVAYLFNTVPVAMPATSDLVVPIGSALHGGKLPALGGGQETVECGYLGLPIEGNCWHNALPQNKEVQDLLVYNLLKYIKATTPKPKPVSVKKPAPTRKFPVKCPFKETFKSGEYSITTEYKGVIYSGTLRCGQLPGLSSKIFLAVPGNNERSSWHYAHDKWIRFRYKGSSCAFLETWPDGQGDHGDREMVCTLPDGKFKLRWTFADI